MGFPGSSVVKNLPANAGDPGDMGSIPGLGRPPRGGCGNPFQYSCLGNFMKAWWATVHGVTEESDTATEHTHPIIHGIISCLKSSFTHGSLILSLSQFSGEVTILVCVIWTAISILLLHLVWLELKSKMYSKIYNNNLKIQYKLYIILLTHIFYTLS